MRSLKPGCTGLGAEDDTPTGYSAETGGPGDDFAVTLLAESFEVQAKRGLSGGQKLREAVDTIAAKLRTGANPSSRVVLAVDISSSVPVRSELGRDLDRLRSGRADDLKSAAKDLLSSAADMLPILRRLTVVCVDTEDESSAQTKEALAALRVALLDPSQASLAWTVLVEDANTACAQRLGRTRKNLVEILESRSIKVKPPAAEEHRILDSCRDLLRKWYVDAAIDGLRTFEREMTKEARKDSGKRSGDRQIEEKLI